MSDMAGIAGNAVSVYQQALTTVSNNIANVATDGYSRQDVALQALPVTQTGQIFLGSGVAVDRIQRQYNEFVDSNLRNSNSDLASQEPMVNYANRVVDVMGGQTMGLNTALDQFFSSARVMSSDPSSSVLRSSFVRDAQGVAERFGQLSSQLSLVQDETQQALDSAVTQINALTKQIAQVNGQLTKKQSEADQPPDLLDQRDLLLRKLSTFAHVNTRFTANGTVSVSLGASMSQDVVVSGNSSLDIAASYDSKNSNKVSLTLDPYGKSTTLNGITSGTVAGILSFREQVLGSAQGSLDNLALTFANAVNTVHQQGIDGYGNPGKTLFNFDPTAANAASGLRVAIDDPMRVSAAAQFRVVEGANNTSGTNASINFEGTPPDGPPPIQTVLVNNDHPSAARLIRVDGSLPIAAVASIPNGMSDVTVYLHSLESGQQLQIMTRDGRQIMGRTMASDPTLIGQMITTANGFAQGATYSTSYLNVSGANGYKDMSVFYGAQAQVLQQPIYNTSNTVVGTSSSPSLLGGKGIQSTNSGIGVGSIILNGIPLGVLANPAAGTTLQARAVASWINEKSITTNVTASASNEVEVTQSQVKYGMPLFINGVSVDTSAASSLSGLALAINNAGVNNVIARIDPNGLLQISNNTGDDITIAGSTVAGSSVQNALGLTAGAFRGRVSLTQAVNDSNGNSINRPIQMGFSSSGGPSDLEKIGFNIGEFGQSSSTKAVPALLEGARMQGSTTGLAETSLTLNAIALGALAAPAAGTTLQASAVAAWINTKSKTTDTNPLSTTTYVTATATNAIVLNESQVKYGMPLWINGVSVDTATATSLNGLATAINNASASNVSARIDSQGQLRISNTTGDDITIAGSNVAGSSVQNALGLTAGTFRGQISLTQALTDSSGNAITRPIQLGFGSTGTPADLAKLGFRTGAFISGAAKEDLLVFVTGAGTATVSASYAGKPIDGKQSLRAQPMKVEFTSATAYKITDTTTNTIVAERTLDPTQLNPGIRYQGIALSFTAAPQAGDVFTLDGNKDGVGNNDNMLALAALEKKPLVGIKTLSNAYIDQVNELGNIARQATIAQSALTVVHDQAVKSRDELSGVSLDKEAADLIRYQQAYQAAAKVLQVASQLFESVLQVR